MEMFFSFSSGWQGKRRALHLFLFLLCVLTAREPNQSLYANRSRAAPRPPPYPGVPLTGGRASPVGLPHSLQVSHVSTYLYLHTSAVYIHKIIIDILSSVFFHPVCHGARFRHVHVSQPFSSYWLHGIG